MTPANVVIAFPQDAKILPREGVAVADLLTLPGRSDAEAEQLMDTFATSAPAGRPPMSLAPEYVAARRVLLDTLTALDGHTSVSADRS